MNPLRTTLAGDGTSDAALRYPILWTLEQHGCPDVELHLAFRPGWPVAHRVRWALENYPCDLLFVHRDAEREPLQHRIEEIRAAVGEQERAPVHVCVVPIRMTEAWLLHDERAIRRAAGNPHGRVDLKLPKPRDVEHVATPKTVLDQALIDAMEFPAHRRNREQRRLPAMRMRVAELIEDWSPVRDLPAFRSFEEQLVTALGALAGAAGP